MFSYDGITISFFFVFFCKGIGCFEITSTCNKMLFASAMVLTC